MLHIFKFDLLEPLPDNNFQFIGSKLHHTSIPMIVSINIS
jgi:hypothetical protein